MLPRHTSISVRVIFALVLATTLLMVAAGWVADREVRRVLQADLQREHATRAEQLSVALTLPVWNFDRDQILRVLDGALLQESAVQAEVRLADRNTTRLARTRGSFTEPRNGQLLRETRPIRFEGQTLGTVEFQVTTAPMEARLERFRAWMIAFGLTVDAGLVAVLSFLLWRSVLRPVREIERFAAAPDAAAPAVHGKYRGELESLRSSLVAMIGQLQTNEAHLRLVGDNLPDTMVYELVREPGGRACFLHISAGVERLHGIKADEAMRDADILYRQIVEEDRPAVAAAEAASEAGMTVFNVTMRIRRPDGTIRWMQVCSQPRRLADGRLAWDGIEMDITARKETEHERERLAQVIESYDEAAYWLDTHNRFVYVNDAACRAVGYTRDELIGRHISLIAPRVSDALLEFMWKQLRTEGSFRREGLHRRKNGTDFPVEISGTHVRFDGQELNCGFARDISARQEAEQDLQRQLNELRRWQQVTLSREDRIAQLKAEVNALCERAGQPLRYSSQARGDAPAVSEESRPS